MVMRQLRLPMQSIEQQFRRMVFNIVARNQDDHVKNIAFMMNKSGEWSLSPAFDVTYSFNPTGVWTARHQMTMNGKRESFTQEDFNACARTASMKRGRAKTIVAEVQAAVSKWRTCAEQAASEYLKQAQAGQRLTVADRGRPIAILSPAQETPSVDWVHALVAEGRAHWSGGEPVGLKRRVKSRGVPTSTMVIEDRR